MGDKSLSDQLRASASYQSLIAEQQVQQVLKEYDWSAFQGTFYRDKASGKLREIDVLARQTWELFDESVTIALESIIEVKSARGYHLLFSPSEAIPVSGHLTRQWFGGHGLNEAYLRSVLGRSGLNEGQVSRLVGVWENTAYPNGRAVVEKLMVDPPPLEWQAVSFRETNIGGEKELENSVLWKATQGLMSAVKALVAARRRSRLNDLRVYSTIPQKSSNLNFLASKLEEAIRSFDQFHPVIVIDSKLWSASPAGIEEIPWCRLVQANTRGFPHFWVDVVNSGEFARYSEHISNAYKDIFEAAGAEHRYDEFLL